MSENSNVIITKATKSPGIAVILSLLFGPIGMFYSTMLGGLIMLIPCIIIGVATMGFGFLIMNPICAIWAGVAAGMYNSKLLANTKS